MRVQDRFRVSARLVNDVVAAAAGEATFGAGKGHDDFVCIFVGTGIGGAVYQGGVPYRGASNTAGELGHIVVVADGRLCGCGGHGHLEAYSSRTAIVRSIFSVALRLAGGQSLPNMSLIPIRTIRRTAASATSRSRRRFARTIRLSWKSWTRRQTLWRPGSSASSTSTIHRASSSAVAWSANSIASFSGRVIERIRGTPRAARRGRDRQS